MTDEQFAIFVLFIITGFFCYICYTSHRTPTINEMNHPVLIKIRSNFAKINPSYGNIPIVLSTNGAYTEDKKFIAMCITNPKTGQPYNFNEIMYVSLHELAHFTSSSYGHNQEFMNNFAKLLYRARQLGIYTPIDPPRTFCE
jgi:hypothetical protein